MPRGGFEPPTQGFSGSRISWPRPDFSKERAAPDFHIDVKERQLFNAELGRARTQGAVMAALVRLYGALGAGGRET